jgi:hypothetical protein
VVDLVAVRDVSRVSVLRDMVSWRERKLAAPPQAPTAFDLRRMESWREELEALRYLMEITGSNTYPNGVVFPQGLWSDHHAAMHTDCDWDWAGAMEAEAARDKAYSDEAKQEPPPVIQSPATNANDER